MKQRAFQKAKLALDERVANMQKQAESKKAFAFEVAEIKEAHTAFVFAMFDEKKRDTAQQNYSSALKKYGFCEQDFEYIPSCHLCGDTGVYQKKPCKCIFDDYVKYLKQESDIEQKAKFTFADCDLKKVKDEQQKANLKTLYTQMKTYTAKYPATKTRTWVFSGAVGTGKTCLASATVRAAVEKGYSAKVVSAYELNSLMLTTHTSPIAERNALLHDVMSVDYLLIDDLGTEPMLKNVTVEYLLVLLEERLNRGLCTIITTNLTPERILNRYGERIYSRLSDKQHSKFVTINGKDLRIN